MDITDEYGAIQLDYTHSEPSPMSAVLFEQEQLENNTDNSKEVIISDKPIHNVEILDSSLDKFNLDVRQEFEQEKPIDSPITSSGSDDLSVICDNKLLFKVGLSLLPQQREMFSKSLGGCFNLMVAGQVGVGKTSFINTLFDTDLLPVGNDFSNPCLSVSRFELISENYPLRLCTIETVGFGQNIDNEGSWIPISEFIDEQFKLYLFQDQQPERSKKVDNRIHCCVYLLPPSIGCFSLLDLETLKSLSSRVNVIPVISKCDSIDVKTLQNYKATCKNLFEQHNIKFCEFFYDEEVTSLINEKSPFSLINSDTIKAFDEGFPIRGRNYPWGFVEVEDESLCDFNLLRKILMSEHMLEFIVSTESHYENFRTSFLNTIMEENLKLDLTFKTGLEEYKAYKSFGYNKYKESVKNNDYVFKYKEEKLKARFNNNITIQEQRFKQWKKALVEKQNELNRDIEQTHEKLVTLQLDLTSLEEKALSEKSASPHIDITIRTKELKFLNK